jgi:hypothetical protein
MHFIFRIERCRPLRSTWGVWDAVKNNSTGPPPYETLYTVFLNNPLHAGWIRHQRKLLEIEQTPLGLRRF